MDVNELQQLANQFCVEQRQADTYDFDLTRRILFSTFIEWVRQRQQEVTNEREAKVLPVQST